jgi:hypothetical protein
LSRWSAVALVSLLLPLVGSPLPPPTLALAATSSGITVLQSEARLDYPRTIDFHVVAQSTGQITQARLAYRVANDSVIHLGKADLEPTARVDTHYVVDLQRAYYPPGVTIQYQWRLQDLTGAEAETVWASFTLADPRFRWHAATKGLVQLHWHDVDEAYANAVLSTADATYAAGRAAASTSSAAPINAFLYGRLADFRGVLGAGSQEWVGGQTFPHYRVVLLLVSPTDVASAQRSVAHEMTHMLLDDVAEGTVAPLPTWLDEGLAMVAEGSPQPAFAQALDQAARSHQLLSIQSLSGNFPDDSAKATVAYVECESLVRYFLGKYGQAKLATLINDFRDGASPDEAFSHAIGMSARDFEMAWEASLAAAPLPAATPIPTTSSGLGQVIMLPIRAVIGFVASVIQSLFAPKVKLA